MDLGVGDPHREHGHLSVASGAILALALATLFLFVGCGQIARGALSGALATATTSSGASATAAAASLTGCPVKEAPPDAAALAPDVTVTHEIDSTQPVMLARGQHLEVRLAPGMQWRIARNDPSHVLAPASAEGWYDPSANVCVWRFAAVNSGRALLAFDGLIPCRPANLHCVAATDRVTFAVTVR